MIVTGVAAAAWLWAPATSAGADIGSDATSDAAADAATSGVLTPLAGIAAGALILVAGLALVIDARRSRRSPVPSPAVAASPHHRAAEPMPEPVAEVSTTDRAARPARGADARADGDAPVSFATAADLLFRNRLAAGLQDELFTHRGASISGS